MITPPDGGPAKPREHIFVSNRAFTRMTGIKKVCMMCGLTDPKSKCERLKQ